MANKFKLSYDNNLLLFSLVGLFTLSSCASPTRITIKDSTELKINPDGKAGTAAVLEKGETVSLSDSTIFGFYRATTSTNRDGWIQASQIDVPSRTLASTGSGNVGKWGLAGCGIGSMIFKDQPGKIQILSAITNDYFGQTFSITSGTSNCVEMGGHEEAMLYININHKPLAKDISRGEGETLEGLAKVMGCSDHDQLGSTLQKNYKVIFSGSQATPESVAQSIENTIKSNADLKANCALYG